MNYERLKFLIKQKGVTVKWLCGQIEMSETGFAKMMREESMKVETLERISELLGVKPFVFFDDDIHAPFDDTANQTQEIMNLTRQLTKTQQELIDAMKAIERLRGEKDVPAVVSVTKLTPGES